MSLKKSSSITRVSTDKADVQGVVDRAIQGDAVIYINNATYKPEVEFFMLFGANFNAVLAEHRFTMTDMRVLFAVLSKMSFGNQIDIKQKGIAKELGMDASNVSKSWRTLLDLGVFVKDEFDNEFLNYDLFLKGKTKAMLDEYLGRATLSHEKVKDIKGVMPPFDLDYVREVKKKREKKQAYQDAIAEGANAL